MIAADTLLDTFINANILFILGFGAWSLLRTGLNALGLHRTVDTQLRLLNVVFFAIICAPCIALAYGMLQRSGWLPGGNINLSDQVVAYYLNGGLDMKASDFEALILSRDTFILNVVNGSGLVAQAAIALFAVGFCVGLARMAYSVVCLKRIVTGSYAWRRFGRVHLRISDRTLVPFSTRGLRAYYIVIPSHLLTQRDVLRVSLAHELQHIRQGDLEWEVALESLKPLFFLNPAYRAWKRQVEHLRELRCDHAVLARGRIKLQTYCESLLSICQDSLRRDRMFVLAVPKVTLVTADRSTILGRRRSLLEDRIRSVLETRPMRFSRLLFLASLAPVLAFMLWATIAIQSPGDWSQDRLMLSTVVNLDRLAEINRLSAFGTPRQ